MNGPVVAAWNYDRTADDCLRVLKSMGEAAVLRRGVAPNTADRPCQIFFRRHSVREMMGGLVDPMERRVIMAAKGLSVPPDFNIDSLVTFVQPMADPPVEHENLRITKPAEAVGPAGTVVLWRLYVRR